MKKEHIKLINNYIQNLQRSSRPLAIFDLDSTLYNVSPRTHKIVQDFCLLDETKNSFPEESNSLKDIPIEPTDWGYLEALERHNLVASARSLRSLSIFWRQHFFSNTYMEHDTPYLNSPNFVKRIQSLNCEIIYLTGRARKKMLTGSLMTLRRDLFPLNDENSLVMKENPDLPDHIYKSEFIQKIKLNYDNIILFENEPKIINRVNKDHPEVNLCFINSTHSRAETLNLDLPTIEMDYSPLLTDK